MSEAKLVSELEIGDEVILAATGKRAQVKLIYRGEDDSFTIKFHGGSSVELHGNARLKVIRCPTQALVENVIDALRDTEAFPSYSEEARQEYLVYARAVIPLITRQAQEELLREMMTAPLEEAFAAAYCEWQREYNPRSVERGINAFIRLFAEERHLNIGEE